MKTTSTTPLACSQVVPDGGERLRVFDEEFLVKVEGSETNETYALAFGSVAPGGGPPLHAHPVPETIYVLSGEFAFTQRDERGVSTSRGGPGTVFHAPPGALHRFENVSATRSSILLVLAPQLLDFVRELAADFPPGSEPNLEKMLTINAKYAVETVHGEEGSRPEPPRDGATSARARMLGWRFEQANQALIETIERCTPEGWKAVCADTGWTVAVQAHHIALGEAAIAAVINDVSQGRPHPPMPAAKLNQINARHAAEFANVTIEETVDLLRRNGASAAHLYQFLSDEQLRCSWMSEEADRPTSVLELIEHLAIGEIERHGTYIRAAINS